ncbi:MAG: hypothetical protein EAZ08_06205 [Cytophagales bacterium]|nr:MAG: hypothetical protein EAZ08_06205 [Cytophagales bacterium]
MLTDRELDSLLSGTGVQLRQKQGILEQLKALFTDPSLPSLLLIIGLTKMIGVAIFIYCLVNP